jgi:hypothetical protein
VITLAKLANASKLSINPPRSATHPGYTQRIKVIIGVIAFCRSVATTSS